MCSLFAVVAADLHKQFDRYAILMTFQLHGALSPLLLQDHAYSVGHNKCYKHL